MKKLKVMTVVGTRPEIIRLSRVITALNNNFNHTLVHTGQNYDYELNQIFFNDLGLKEPDVFLKCNTESPMHSIADTLVKIDTVIEKIKPDAFLVLGDTNSCLSAIAAKRKKIPIFHMEAGNRCFDQRVPEETNRKIVDHISDINLTYSAISREYLLNEGLPAERVIKTGSPMKEVLNYHKEKIEKSDILKRLKLKPQKYYLVSCHREENVDSDKNIINLVNTLNLISNTKKLPILISLHPRTKKNLKKLNVKLLPEIMTHKPFAFTDYINLQKNSKAVISDSGTINEESSILNFPAINIREAHERPEAMEEASVIMSGLQPNTVLQALKVIDNQPREEDRILNIVKDYSDDNVSEKVIRIILSYVNYVNSNVWKK